MEVGMGRTAQGRGQLQAAYVAIAAAQTVEQLRMAQAVVLPLACGLNLAETGRVLGVSPGWASQLRGRFLRGERIADGAVPRGGRHHAYLNREEEQAFLQPYLETAAVGGVLVVPPLKAALEQRLARTVALSSVYRMLHRHGWRKLAPDKRHPQSDPVAQEAWKKNFPGSSRTSRKTGRGKARSG
jgi:transposase